MMGRHQTFMGLRTGEFFAAECRVAQAAQSGLMAAYFEFSAPVTGRHCHLRVEPSYKRLYDSQPEAFALIDVKALRQSAALI